VSFNDGKYVINIGTTTIPSELPLNIIAKYKESCSRIFTPEVVCG